MSAFNHLPRIYQLAIFLGARVEVFHNDKWYNLHDMMGIASKTKYRIMKKDLPLFKKAKEIAAQTHTIVKYKDYDYMMPNIALTPGSIVIMEYGFGIYVQVQEDLTLVDLEREEAKKILEENDDKPYYSQSHSAFFK